jgi:hypothetical protein
MSRVITTWRSTLARRIVLLDRLLPFDFLGWLLFVFVISATVRILIVIFLTPSHSLQLLGLCGFTAVRIPLHKLLRLSSGLVIE